MRQAARSCVMSVRRPGNSWESPSEHLTDGRALMWLDLSKAYHGQLARWAHACRQAHSAQPCVETS
jgi:hypothetical protein